MELVEQINNVMDGFFTTEDSAEDISYELDIPRLKCECGVTKVCFNHYDLPYVIKCGLDGYYNSDGDEVYFESDSAMDELEIYEEFDEQGLSCLLAKTEKIDERFIKAEKVVPFFEYDDEELDEMLDEYVFEEEEWHYAEYCVSGFNVKWTMIAIAQYGLDTFQKFYKKAKREYLFLDDMHYGNYGFTKEGMAKILDWGGCSNFSWND